MLAKTSEKLLQTYIKSKIRPFPNRVAVWTNSVDYLEQVWLVEPDLFVYLLFIASVCGVNPPTINKSVARKEIQLAYRPNQIQNLLQYYCLELIARSFLFAEFVLYINTHSDLMSMPDNQVFKNKCMCFCLGIIYLQQEIESYLLQSGEQATT